MASTEVFIPHLKKAELEETCTFLMFPAAPALSCPHKAPGPPQAPPATAQSLSEGQSVAVAPGHPKCCSAMPASLHSSSYHGIQGLQPHSQPNFLTATESPGAFLGSCCLHREELLPSTGDLGTPLSLVLLSCPLIPHHPIRAQDHFSMALLC